MLKLYQIVNDYNLDDKYETNSETCSSCVKDLENIAHVHSFIGIPKGGDWLCLKELISEHAVWNHDVIK